MYRVDLVLERSPELFEKGVEEAVVVGVYGVDGISSCRNYNKHMVISTQSPNDDYVT